MKLLLHIPALLALLLFSGLCAAMRADESAQAKPADPYQVRAAMLAKVPAYIKWPDALFKSKDAPLCVGVLGADPFHELLDGALKGQRVGTHAFVPARFATAAEIRECHVLFVPQGEEAALEKLVERFKGQNVLLVGDTLAAAEHGAGIALYVEKAKVRLAVNLDALHDAGIEASSELLKLAKVILRKEGEGK